MNRILIFVGALVLMVLITNCKKELDPVDPINPNDTIPSMKDLVIADDFNFETSKDIELTINGFKSSKADGDIRYDIYLYNSAGINIEATSAGDDGDPISQSGLLVDVMNNLNTIQITNDPNFNVNITVPGYYDTLYVVQNDMGHYNSMLLPITSNKMAIEFPATKETLHHKFAKEDPTDMLYAVNSLRELFSINPLTGEIEMLPSLPANSGGSWACAIDPVEEILYTVGISSPNNLYAYDLNTQTWETKGSIGYQGPRLGYNVSDGMLYYSFGYWMLVIDPDDGHMVSYYRIYGLHETNGGDVCFADNGTMYMSSTSGLYKCAFDGGNNINAERLSAENLPNYPNSLTFDQNQELWWATNIGDDKGKTFIMDTVTGSFEDRWAFPNNYIHDLATMPLDENEIPDDDSDGDGIIDFYDEYPNDGDKAYDTYTPSIYGWGSYAFEDLWPDEGDYDFNDLVLNYRYTHVYNSADLIVETLLTFDIKNVGGSFRNGFGIELDMDETLIDKVTGIDLTTSIISLNAKGLEDNQDKPVLILFDDAWASSKVSSNLELIITYISPIELANFGTKNPFIFIDGDRGREVHLSDMAPTSLANMAYFNTADDDSNLDIGRYYKTKNNLPWAIDIIHDFVYLKEKKAIILGYNKFADWAESGGVDYPDWYKDQDGYRNNTYLDN